MITTPFFVVENLNNIRPYGSTTMRGPCSTSTAVWNPRGTRSTLRSYWSVQITPRANNWLPTRGMGRGTSTRSLHNNRLNWRIQPLHVGMQPPAHFSTVVFMAHANGRKKCQQLPTLLGVVGQQCCIRLHEPKSLTGFKLYATSANKCQHCCDSIQTDATRHNIVGPNNVGCCWPTMLGPFAWAFRNRTWKPQFLSFVELVNVRVRIISILMQL